MKKRTIHERIKRAEKAWNELGLSLLTKVDKERWFIIHDGMVALDEEQSKMKAAIELLFDEHADCGKVSFEQIKEALAAEGVTLEKRSGA